MAKTSTVNARVDPKLKNNVEIILERLGLTPSDAVNLFYKQVELKGGLPFELKLPNYNIETLEVLEEARQLAKDKSVPTYGDIDSLRRALDL